MAWVVPEVVGVGGIGVSTVVAANALIDSTTINVATQVAMIGR